MSTIIMDTEIFKKRINMLEEKIIKNHELSVTSEMQNIFTKSYRKAMNSKKNIKEIPYYTENTNMTITTDYSETNFRNNYTESNSTSLFLLTDTEIEIETKIKSKK
jgi:hypothetical protein